MTANTTSGVVKSSMRVPIIGWVAGAALGWTCWGLLYEDLRGDDGIANEATVSSRRAA